MLMCCPGRAREVSCPFFKQEVVELVGELADYHAAQTAKKQRMAKPVDEPDFPRRISTP